MRAVTFVAFLFLASPSLAAAEKDDRLDCAPGDNARLCVLYRADQEIRKAPIVDLASLENPAAVRATQEMIRHNALSTGNDYYKAATLLLHSSKPQDYLLSHIVASRGLAKEPGHVRVRLVAALSLDRYLVSLNQRQIFGTQTSGMEPSGPRWHPYDCNLNSRLRTAFLGAYPEPCRTRSGRFSTLVSRLPFLARRSRVELVEHVRALDRLARSPTDPDIRWRAAASLDSVLLALGQPQVFGTRDDGHLATARLDCGLLNPSIRDAFAVPDLCSGRSTTTTALAR